MGNIFPILIAVIIALIFIILLTQIFGRSKKSDKTKKNKDRSVVMRDATKRLAQNPRDYNALLTLGDIYYQDQAWENAAKAYQTLLALPSGQFQFDKFEVSLRCGIANLKLNKFDEALSALNTARMIKQNNFEVNYNLGYIHYEKKDYEKAVQFLRYAVSQNPEHAQSQKFLGLSLHKIGKNNDALIYLKKALDLIPDDKESFFTMGECLYDMNSYDRALKIFSHLRPDPVFGAQSALYAGIIHNAMNQNEEAAADFEIGLKHQNTDPSVAIELQYRLATTYIKLQDISKAVAQLRSVQAKSPNYKDVAGLINKYSEMNSNKNLQTYLMANQSNFITLCRRITTSFFPKSKVKILDISSSTDYTDILTDVENSKWQDVILFRFFRNSSTVGELLLRDFHAHIKETKAGKGVCLTAGTFSSEAKHFVEARIIDLIEKDKLSKILNNLDASKRA